ncbi:hypothetical protein LVJ85_05955 [Neisseria sp. Dent CA1/247]|uniref:hypothetical protein n=1 Tax=Neisseria sp. Dent CA1/247 TaxID=2912675 RepID=UPI001FD10621|nr:hypothetical protein [Neisseria sp. Dent CA1/247]UOO76752.1 hypothetical protein LVJ85_12235 [Neisseria sp. Dent CA1/247]UOO77633.1 hypothetical protein LVJ85_03950 [Neisseria sp. Dent CA1/247]UOO78002.1 hypothetical protein LVJ85_05955 [Neisseria sp. Dent CA1/247]
MSAVELITSQLGVNMADIKEIGYLVVAAYVSLFAIAIIKSIFDLKKKRESQEAKERKEEINLKLAEIRLRLAEIKLAKEEAIWAAAQKEEEPESDEEVQQLAAEEFDLEEEINAILAEMDAQECGMGF